MVDVSTTREVPKSRANGVARPPPPYDLNAEAAVLSAVMLDGAALDKLGFLKPEHFYEKLTAASSRHPRAFGPPESPWTWWASGRSSRTVDGSPRSVGWAT